MATTSYSFLILFASHVLTCDGTIIEKVLEGNTAQINCIIPRDVGCKDVFWSRSVKGISWENEDISHCTNLLRDFRGKFRVRRFGRTLYLEIYNATYEDTQFQYSCNSITGENLVERQLQVYAPTCTGVIITTHYVDLNNTERTVFLNCSIGIPTLLEWSDANGTQVESIDAPGSVLNVVWELSVSEKDSNGFQCSAHTHLSRQAATCFVFPETVTLYVTEDTSKEDTGIEKHPAEEKPGKTAVEEKSQEEEEEHDDEPNKGASYFNNTFFIGLIVVSSMMATAAVAIITYAFCRPRKRPYELSHLQNPAAFKSQDEQSISEHPEYMNTLSRSRLVDDTKGDDCIYQNTCMSGHDTLD